MKIITSSFFMGRAPQSLRWVRHLSPMVPSTDQHPAKATQGVSEVSGSHGLPGRQGGRESWPHYAHFTDKEMETHSPRVSAALRLQAQGVCHTKGAQHSWVPEDWTWAPGPSGRGLAQAQGTSLGPGVRFCGFQSQLCHLPALRPCISWTRVLSIRWRCITSDLPGGCEDLKR